MHFLAIDLVTLIIVTSIAPATIVVIQSKSEPNGQNGNTKGVDDVTHDAKQCRVCVALSSGIVSSV